MAIIPSKAPHGLDIFIEKELDRYWHSIYGGDDIKDDETIRVVRQVKNLDGTKNKFEYVTENMQINKLEQFKLYVNDLQNSNPDKMVGVSISTAIFEYDPNRNPCIATFRRTKAISVDIDTHIDNGNDRYELGTLEPDQIKFALIEAWNQINIRFKAQGLDIIRPSFTMLTGGGLQIVFEFDRELSGVEADKLFKLLKKAIGNLKWEVALKNILDQHSLVSFDIDTTFSDVAHVQRANGVINQKYGTYAKEFAIFDMTEPELLSLGHHICMDIDSTGYEESVKEKMKRKTNKAIVQFMQDSKDIPNQIEVQANLMTATMQANTISIKPSELQSIEYELLLKIKESGVDVLELLAGEVRKGVTTGNLTKLFCPFHEEQNPSMAFYKNDLIDVFRDFHDDTTYNLINFWEKYFKCSKTEAITKISDVAKIKLGKSERKDFQNLELDEIVLALLDKVDKDNFVYYRLANKNRVCIVRHIDSGESFIFDGPKMLATHVLSNQLNIDDAEKFLIEKFVDKFTERILIEAFEEFRPGQPTVFSKQFIKFVNMWVPNDKYKRVHEYIKESMPEGNNSIPETINLLKERCPWAFKYVLQIIQKGDLEWFINWLSATSKFKVMPTVPVVFGVQGSGKNLFVSTIMDFYLNNEYVKVLNGDRIMNNFNSVLETASLIVLDEGDFSSGREVDQLKLLTGNSKILVEKKGVDVTNKDRHFNFLFFSNGEVPVRHPAMDRRITYFKNEISLLKSCEAWGISIDTFIDRVQSELVEFWSIIYKTELNKDYTMTNAKNGQFWEQIMKMHPFGNLVMKLINKDWNDIALQLNENVSEPAMMQANLNLLVTIKDQFESEGKLSLTLINRYLQSMNYKVKTSIQYYIQVNHLEEFGVSINVEESDVNIIINKKKVAKAISVDNLLVKEFPMILKQKDVSILEAQVQENHIDATLDEDDNFIPGLNLPNEPNIN